MYGITRSPIDFGGVVRIKGTLTVSDNYPAVADSVTFTLTLDGAPQVLYQWFRNGVPISGATSATYTIAEWEIADLGSYTVSVTDGFALETFGPEIVGTPNAGKSHIEIFGPMPAANTLAYRQRLVDIENQRQVNCPLIREKVYYFGLDGDDFVNDGSAEFPFQTSSRVDEILNPLSMNRINTNKHTVASSAGFYVDGKSFWCGAFVSNPNGYYGPLFEIAGQIGIWLGSYPGDPSGSAFKIIIQYYAPGESYITSSVLIDTTLNAWTLIMVWYDHTTRTLYISANNGTPETHVLPAQLAASTSPFTLGGGYFGNGYAGDMARAFFVRDYNPSSGDRGAMFNSRKGSRGYLLPKALKARFVANNGSFWDFAGYYTATTFPDTFSGQTFHRTPAQGPALIAAPDQDDPPTVVDGRIVGGISCLLKRGETFFGGIHPNRPIWSIGAWGSGTDRAYCSVWDIAVPNVWTAIGEHYKVTTTANIGWVEPLNDYKVIPRVRQLKKVASASDCNSTINSFWFDIAMSELHVNVGMNPARYAPEGWRATHYITSALPSNESFGNGSTVVNGRLQDVQFDGNVNEPGNPSGYGFQVVQNAASTVSAIREEFVTENCVYTGGYHNVGWFGTGIIALAVDCTLDLMCGRNNSGAIGDFSGTSWVSFGDQQEVFILRTRIGGWRPSYDEGGVTLQGGIIHGPSTQVADLIIDKDTYYMSNMKPLGTGSQLGQNFRGSNWLTDYPCYVIGSTSDLATYPFGIGVCLGAINIDYHAPAYLTGAPQSLFYTANIQAINCTFLLDQENVNAPFWLIRDTDLQSTILVNVLNCHLEHINVAPTATSKIIATSHSVSGIGIVNTTMVMTGGGTKLFGDIDASKSSHNAFFGLTGSGTGSVALVSRPALTNPTGSSQLIGAAVAGTEYDQNEDTRITNDIGPLRAL